MHFLQNPVGEPGEGSVTGLRTDRQILSGYGTVSRTGQVNNWDVQAVYHAIRYRSGPLDDLP